MVHWLVYAMVYLGSALMVYNIYGFLRFARYIRNMKMWRWGNSILYFPIVLLVLFLLGYLVVGFFGEPDIVVAGILFGGSVFVLVMYKLFSGIIQRVIEIEHLEAELLASEESNRAKSSLLASVSHEMRTPMNVILGLNTLALKNPELPDSAREQLEKVGHSASHLSDLINGILDMQQFESGEMALHSETFSLKKALEQINAIISTACEEKGLDYETSFAECATRDYTGDAMHLKQAVLCLLDNAVKFTDAPGTVRFSVSCTKDKGVCTDMRFIVADTGIGIDEAFLSQIFEPFAKEDASSTNRFGGIGMGLATAKSIVTHMGGTIEAASTKGEGSTFTITIPLPPPQAEAEAQGDSCGCCAGCGDEATPLRSLEGYRVLIVDDMAENAEIVSDLLELEGVESDSAENGLAAVKKMEQSEANYYDAILMDLRMPVMDGLEAIRRIRALGREDAGRLPIIALSANGYDSDVRASLEAGANAHLVKPVDAEKLYAALAEWFGKASGKGVVSV